jgi:hypothetical protein
VLTDQLESYQHVVQALGGYWSATFTIAGSKNDIEGWIEDGVGRHVEVRDHVGDIMFEGFVNQVNATIAALSVTRGPLLGAGNRVNLTYSTVDTSTNPPTVGGRTRTGVANDTDSQALYGILETYLSSGGATDTEATEARNNWIAERALPKTTKQFSLGRSGVPTAQISCLGYTHWLTKFVYNQTTNSGTQNLSVKLTDIISAQLNTLLDEGFDEITANTVAVKEYEDDDRTAWDLIKALVSLGDAADNRYTFGVYANRIPFYEAAPTTLDYVQRLTDMEQLFQDVAGQRILPWNVRPGRWVLFSDLLVGRVETTTNLRDDPRAMFIEAVNYTAPWGLNLRGGDVDTIDQKLAKLGLGGLGG